MKVNNVSTESLVLNALDNTEAYQLYKKQFQILANESEEYYCSILHQLANKLLQENFKLKVSTDISYLKKHNFKYAEKYQYLTDAEINKLTKYFKDRGFIVSVKPYIKLVPFRPGFIKFTVGFDFSQNNN